MIYRIEVAEKDGFRDPLGLSIKKDIEDLGYAKKIRDVRTVRVYLLAGHLNESDVKRVSEELLIDRITQSYRFEGPVFGDREREYRVIEVAYHPGVMDPVEESCKKAIIDLGIHSIKKVRTAKKYLLKGALSKRDVDSISEKLLYNKLIQHVVTTRDLSQDALFFAFKEPPPYDFKLVHRDLRSAGDKRLERISTDGHLFLNLEEMRAIKRHFASQGRDPTDCELETIAQTWSEHCKHKTMRGLVEYEGKVIDNLLKNTIMKVTAELAKPWCVSVFHDNSGIIRFDRTYDVCFKVETHNHPSALEPYGGAGTGIGGVIRDPLGTGLGAKPIVNTDIFCFGPPDYPYEKLPPGTLHPKRVMKGVVAGVRDYGNRMGIPTSNGAVLFDEDFVGNPLVFCGNVGLIPRNRTLKKVHRGDLVVLIGGRTGRDGIHGATFSSGELTHKSGTLSGSCVQIGNPITEKKMADVLLQARDRGLYHAITDCGGGGLSSAVGEMGEETGVDIELSKVPLKYKGLSYTEIWISEAQERMVLSVDPKRIDELVELFEGENVEITVIGRFTGTTRLRLFYDGTLVADLGMKFLHEGLPKIVRKAVWKKRTFPEPSIASKSDRTDDLLGLLSSLNIASKEWIIRQYDHEVQGGSVLKPLQGVENDGPGDACVIRPLLDSKKGIILGCGINPEYGKIDPYWMAASVIDEALRQITSVGGDIRKAAILDNFCWGNTDKPDRLGGLVRASQGCYDIAKGYSVPFISGKDSLNNEYFSGRKTIAIPPTLLISCIAVMDDVSKAVTMDAKEPGNAVYLVGVIRNEMGGSQFYKMRGHLGNDVPRVDANYGARVMRALFEAMGTGCVRSCHDCSDGGLAVALAEMAFAGGLGMEIRLGRSKSGQEDMLQDYVALFSESNTRFVAEVSDEARFERSMKGVPIGRLGRITRGPSFKIFNRTGRLIVRSHIDELKAAWKRTFKDI